MIIDGRAIATKRLEELKNKIAEFGLHPKLNIVLIGDDPASKIYVNLKQKRAAEVGITTEVTHEIDLSADGIIVQLPSPTPEIVDHIPPEKDVDGLTGKGPYLPATVRAILNLVNDKTGQWVVVGQGRLVGKPLSEYLESKGHKVIKCDIDTADLKSQTLLGDILVSATGVAGLIKVDMVKPGAVVIDCGSPVAEVDPAVAEITSAMTPVPGGVGPMTVVSLLENVTEAAKIRTSNMASV